MIAYYRAQNPNASRDSFAHLWIRDGVATWANQFEEHVSHYEGILHCMRNRYFHDALQQYTSNNPTALCLNLGAGFSMYPYSLPETLVHLEIDFPEIVQFKDENTAQFNKAGNIPHRNVTRLAANIVTNEGQDAIRKALSNFQKTRKIILIEGVFFFLRKNEIASVLDFCRGIMKPGDVLLCNSYADTVKDTAVFQRLTNYFATELNVTGQANTALPLSFFETLPQFTLQHHCGTLELGKQLEYIPSSVEEEQVLNEQCYTLEYMGND
jgi:O-methyltransferase involved in polyketide biosynthesis